MACGCGCGGNKKTKSIGDQIEDVFDGDKKLGLKDALQMISALATIGLFVKYLFKN